MAFDCRIPFRGPIYLIRMLLKTYVSYLTTIKSENKLDTTGPLLLFHSYRVAKYQSAGASLVRELVCTMTISTQLRTESSFDSDLEYEVVSELMD